MSAAFASFRGGIVRRYGVATAAVAAAALVQAALQPIVGDAAQYMLFIPAVMLAAAAGGTGPGLAATALSALTGAALFVIPHGGLPLLGHPDDLIRLAVFLVVALTASLMAGRLRAARAEALRQAEAARDTARFPEEDPAPVLRMGREGQLLYANPAAMALMAKGGKHQGPEVSEPMRQAVANAFESGVLELEMACGGRELSFVVVPVAQHGYANLYGRDTTESKRAKRALVEAEAKYRCLVEEALVGVYLIQGGRFLYVNACMAEIFGYAPGEIVAQRSVLDLVAPEDRPLVAENLRKREDGQVNTIQYAFKGLRRDGQVIDVEVIGTRTLYDGKPAVIGSLLDVTERKRAEEDLRHSEMFHRQTLESIPGMVFTTRPDGYCDYQSRQWVEFTGVPLDQHRGDGWTNLLHPEDRARAFAAWRAAVEGNAPYDLEYRVRRRDGAYRWFRVLGRPIRDEQGRIVRWFGVCLDVEDLKRAQEDLAAAKTSAEHARAAAERANAAKDQFLAVLSHELRTPLTPVLAAVAMLQMDARCDPSLRETLEMVRRNIEMEARLIDDLLDITRIARGKIELDMRPVELRTVIARAAEVCRADIEARGLHFGVDIDECAPHWVEADAARLQQVFWNLIKNAVKFTPHGGCVGVRCRGDVEGHAIVEINDSGIGIEPEAMGRIFNAFEQAERWITRQFGGLGLGLAISRVLVEMHGGTITAHSDGKLKGASFRVRLPALAPERRPERSTEQPPAPAGQAPARGLRILLVEDHGDTAKMMRRLLMMDGHDVTVAGDVATALEEAARRCFDLVLSDLGLPDASGLDLLRELRQRGSTMPAIALSGYGQEEDIRRSKEAGFSTHLTKPTSPDRLAKAIAVLAGQCSPPAEKVERGEDGAKTCAPAKAGGVL